MFEDLERVDDAAVVAVIEDSARAEAAAGAARLAAIAELVSRRTNPVDEERVWWACDFWDSAAAEVACALNISHRRASTQMRQALALRDRLPKVAALYRDGYLSARLIATIAWRTHLVDDHALGLIDTALAGQAHTFGPLSDGKLEQAIDALIDRHDPDALRRTRLSARSRDLLVGHPDDDTGTASVWGRLLATDAAVLHRRVTAMAHGVCENDPRSMGERRADALGALANGTDRLACACSSPDCTTNNGEPPASPVVIHVLAEQPAVTTTPDLYDSDHPQPAAPKPPTALIVGGGVLPTPLLAELIRGGATVRPIKTPADTPEPGYRPSVALAEFVRMRDLTCRFPGCDVPADRCDVDHTIPYPLGPTHPSNLKCECRKHHLLKTFWTGTGGWADQQLPDGTVIWTSPTGKTYTTNPGSRIFFPTWNVTTANLPTPPGPPTITNNRGLMMPQRRRSRAQDEAYRIKSERALNNTERRKAGYV